MIDKVEKIIKKKTLKSYTFIIYLINICFLYNKYVLDGLIFLENKNRQGPSFYLFFKPTTIQEKSRTQKVLL